MHAALLDELSNSSNGAFCAPANWEGAYASMRMDRFRPFPVQPRLRMRIKDIFAPRRYLHFDERVGRRVARSIATDPKRVSSWPFLPFIRAVAKVSKIKRKDDGTLLDKIKERPICYAAHKDAAIYAFYGDQLSVKYEQILRERGLEDVATAFRKGLGKCNIHFARDAFEAIGAMGDCVALAFDIESFFDRLNHKFLKAQWKSVLGTDELPPDHYAVYKSLTRFAFVDRDVAFRALDISKHNPRSGGRTRICSPIDFRDRLRAKGLINVNSAGFGIPQGSPMSAVVSNIYMLDFDLAVSERVGQVGGFYRRYCDDTLCIVPPEAADEIESFVMATIHQSALTIQPEKTKRHRFTLDKGRLRADSALQYLGFLFDGERVLIRTAGIARYYSKMRGGVRLAALTKRRADRVRGSKASPDKIKRAKINIRYSYVGRHNFLSYAFRAAREFKETAIKRQMRKHWGKLNAEVIRREKEG